MTQENPDIHAAFKENLPLYLAGGLSPSETADIESHAATCPNCAAELADAQKADAAMRSLFAPLSPDAQFEDRLIAGLQKPTMIRQVHPWVRRAASGVAAAVVLGTVGYYGGHLVNRRPLDRLSKSELAMNMPGDLKQAGGMMQLYPAKVRFLSRSVAATQPQGQDAVRSLGNDFAEETKLEDKPALQPAAPPPSVGHAITLGVTNGGISNDWRDQLARDSDKDSNGEGRRDTAGFQFYYHSSAAGENTVSRGLSELAKTPSNAPTASTDGSIAMGPTDGAIRLGERASGGPGGDATTPHQRQDAAKLQVTGSNSYSGGTSVPTSGGTSVPFINNDTKKAAELEVQDPSAVKVTPAAVDHFAGMQAGRAVAAADPEITATADSLSKPDEIAQATATDADAGPSSTQPSAITPAEAARKIIRTGAMEFEVDSFDSAFLRITKIAAEESGFVASTDSEKLENGKVKGAVTLRCPPEHLDTLVLKLRGLGDLKTQRITAQDVTKQFTDYQSQLRAAHAMEDRLLEIIKTGKGAVKDLVEAEKQLGIYRQQIEHIEGELRYMSSQVALSTLSVSLMERDIRTPFAAVESEQINAGIEAEDVEHARAEALKLIDDAKGRVIESELKKLDAGQLAATLVAEVSPESAGPLGDRLKQLGRVARWEATRKQTTEGGNPPTAQLQPNVKLQRQPTRIALSIYNLANVAPRQVSALTLVADDVPAAYRAILAAVNGNGKTPAIGRIVSANLSAQKPDQTTGSITLEVKTDEAAAMETALHSAGSVLHLSVTQNADQNGVTDAKRGYGISIVASADVPAREQQTITVAAKDVPATYNKLLGLLRDAKTSAHIANSQLTEPEEDNIVGTVDFDIPTISRAAVDAVLADGKQDDVISRNVVRSADTENTLADKLHMTVNIGSAERLPPRETTRLTLQATDVPKALDAAALAGGEGARLSARDLNQQPDGQATAHLVIDVPLSAAQTTLDQLRSLGKVASAESSRDPRVTAGPLARARFEVALENTQTLVSPQEGIGPSIQRGLRTALNGLLWSIQMVVVGLVLVGPFALVIWAIYRAARRRKRLEVRG